MNASELMQKSILNKNFNIRSTIINDNIRVSTAAIFYESSFFGDYYQIETIVFSKKELNKMKIHSTIMCENSIKYAISFHNKLVYKYNTLNK